MAAGAVAAAFAILGSMGLSKFQEISYACNINGLNDASCVAAAWKVGMFGLTAYAIVLTLSVLSYRLFRGTNRTVSLHPTLVELLLTLAFGVLLLHVFMLTWGPAFASRLDENEHYSIFVSAENLLWPLLLQAYLMEKTYHLKTALLSSLLFVMLLSPYRSALLAIFVFGFVVPLLDELFVSSKLTTDRLSHCGKQATLAAIVAIISVWAGYLNTATRAPSMLVQKEAQEAEQRNKLKLLAADTIDTSRYERPMGVVTPRSDDRRSGWRNKGEGAEISKPEQQTSLNQVDPLLYPPDALLTRLLQRAVFPLYQAAIAGHLASLTDFPTIWDELRRKFRLSSAPDLNEFLFRRIYGGESRGQTTTLYYGEAVAYFPGPPLAWMIGAPLLLVACWLLLRSYVVDANTIFGVALWRSSFAGLFPILPAVALQVVAIGLMARTGPASAVDSSVRRVLRLGSTTCLTICMGLVLVAQLWTITQERARRTLLIATFSVADKCILETPTWVTYRVDDAVTDHMHIRSSLSWFFTDSAAVALPYGGKISPDLPVIASYIGTLVRCANKFTPSPVTVTDTHLFEGPLNPLGWLAAISLAFAFVAGIRVAWHANTG